MESAKQVRRNGEKPDVLLLDDDPAFARLVQGAFPPSRYELQWTRTIHDALARVDARIPDAVLVDLAVEEDGLDLLRILRERSDSSTIPIVVVTAGDDTLPRMAALRRGADRYLVKPVTPETLRRVIDEMLLTRGDDLWWTVTLGSDDVEALRHVLIDPTTILPTLAAARQPVLALLEREGRLDVFCIALEPLIRIEERAAWDAFDALRREFSRGLQVVVASSLGSETIAAATYVASNETYLFARAGDGFESGERVRRLEATCREILDAVPSTFPSDEVAIFAGAARAEVSFAPPHRTLYDAIREARDAAERRETRYRQGLSRLLVRAIRQKRLRTVFQPVVDLRDGHTLGWEALTRGPADSEVESPEVLFELAREFRLVWELESLCLENVTPLLDSICGSGRLFFNLEPHFIQQLQSRGLAVLEPLRQCEERVVIEITERSAIRDYPEFRRTIRQLEQMGFQIAIDDCGSGYSTLEAIAELRPDYIKVGTSLLTNVHGDRVRHELVALLARCASGIGATTIAEAIETEAQLQVCRDLGIEAGQGFLFARPAPWEEIAKEP